jgi:hypothetical protein
MSCCLKRSWLFEYKILLIPDCAAALNLGKNLGPVNTKVFRLWSASIPLNRARRA